MRLPCKLIPFLTGGVAEAGGCAVETRPRFDGRRGNRAGPSRCAAKKRLLPPFRRDEKEGPRGGLSRDLDLVALPPR